MFFILSQIPVTSEKEIYRLLQAIKLSASIYFVTTFHST